MNGGSGTSRGRGWTRGARGRGRQNQSFRLAYDGRGLQQTPFPRPLGRGRGGEPRPFQPNPVTSHVPRCPGRGRGLRQPPLMAAPSLPLHHPPPQPHTPQRRHSASHWQELWPTAGSLPRGNPLHRPWERVSDPERVGQAPPTTLCVMTYNVLAQSLVGGNMHLYQDTEALQWERRRQLLLGELREARADIVCLQEVDEEHYHNWFLPELSQLGYCGLYKKRTGDHSDGCAVFYSSHRLQLLEWKPVEFQRRVRVLDRDNVGLVAKFQTPVGKGRTASFCLATTHLLFNPKAGEVKLAQLVCLLAELDQLATSPPGKPRLACIVCGDLNSLPSSPLLRFLERGQLDISGMTREQVAGYYPSGSPNSEPLPVPLLPPEIPITIDSRLLSSLPPSKATPSPKAPPFPCIVHQCLFLSAYPSSRRPTSSPTLSSVTTYHLKGFETVDYIHYTPSSSTRRGSRRDSLEDARQPAGFRLLSRRALISPRQLRQMGPQPHHLLPSDHLWLLACLQLLPGPPSP